MARTRTLIDKLISSPNLPNVLPATHAAVNLPTASPLNDVAAAAPKRIINGIEIIDLLGEKEVYWGEIPREILTEALHSAAASGIEETLRTKLRDCGKANLFEYIFDIRRRSAWMSLFDSNHGKVAMDVGCGYGANTIALSETFDTVIATDMVLERLLITGMRLRQRGIRNVVLIRTTFERNPLKYGAADLICCNGVIEWIGSNLAEGDVDEIQQNVLASFARSLTEEGQLFIGIENRYGIAALAGAPDHSGLPFTSLLPRKLANFCVRFSRRKKAAGEFIATRGYRTYTHSPKVWTRKLAEIGLQSEIWGTNDYNKPVYAMCLRNRHARKVFSVLRKSCHRTKLINILITLLSCRFPACLLIRASKKDVAGVAEKVSRAAQVMGHNMDELSLVDLQSIDSGVTRFIVRRGKETSVLKKIRLGAELRSRKRLVISNLGNCIEETESRKQIGPDFCVWEIFRNPPSMLHAIPPKRGWERRAMRQFCTWAPALLNHLAREERIWSEEDSNRLLLEPVQRIRTLLRQPDWPGVGVVENLAEMLQGKSFRFGDVHGDLVPENVHPNAAATIVEDWNDSLFDSPVGVDACMYAWSVASKRKNRSFEKRLEESLRSLQGVLLPEAYNSRHALIAIAILNWRCMNEPDRVFAAAPHAQRTLLHAERTLNAQL